MAKSTSGKSTRSRRPSSRTSPKSLTPTERTIRPATEADIVAICRQLRFDDRREIYASSGLFPEAGVRHAIGLTRETLVAVFHGELSAIFGVVQPFLLDNVAVPWSVGTDACTRHAKLFALTSREWLEEQRTLYRYLENWVDARNAPALRWARWVGFKVDDAEPRGPFALAFHRISMGAI